MFLFFHFSDQDTFDADADGMSADADGLCGRGSARCGPARRRCIRGREILEADGSEVDRDRFDADADGVGADPIHEKFTRTGLVRRRRALSCFETASGQTGIGVMRTRMGVMRTGRAPM